VPGDGSVEVLQLVDDSVALLLQDGEGTPWLLAEISNFSPDPEGCLDLLEEDYEVPFKTSGDKWFINLTSESVATVFFETGGLDCIQGFVYAMHDYAGGGPLTPELYVEYLRQEIQAAVEEGEFTPLANADNEEIQEFIRAVVNDYFH
jgi:hypothetical protein